MTIYIPFVAPPLSASSPFGFQPTLNFQATNALVPWSLFGNRWYFQLSGTGGTPIVLRASVGSPDGVQNERITAYLEGFVIVETVKPHGYEFMSTVNLTISGAIPDMLNGLHSCFITGPNSYRFSISQIIDSISVYGHTDYNINLVENYIDGSTVVFRESTQNYEVSS